MFNQIMQPVYANQVATLGKVLSLPRDTKTYIQQSVIATSGIADRSYVDASPR